MPAIPQAYAFLSFKAHYPGRPVVRYHRRLFAPGSTAWKAADATQQPERSLKNKKCKQVPLKIQGLY